MAFGIDGTIVITFLSTAFSVLMGAFNFLFTWLARHIVILTASAFLISWFLTFYLYKLIFSLIVRLYGLQIDITESVSLSSIFDLIFSSISSGSSRYPFVRVAWKIFDVLNVNFLLSVVDTVLIPTILSIFVVKFVQKISLILKK